MTMTIQHPTRQDRPGIFPMAFRHHPIKGWQVWDISYIGWRSSQLPDEFFGDYEVLWEDTWAEPELDE